MTRRIVFYRTGGTEPVGEFRLDGSAVTATHGVEDLLENARLRGEADVDVFERHAAWTNGYFSSLEVDA